MSTVTEITLTDQPQKFSITLGDTVYFLNVYWINCINGGWTLDVSDSTNSLLVGGIPMVPGLDLLWSYKYMGFPGGLVVQSDGANWDQIPGIKGFTVDSHLYFVTL